MSIESIMTSNYLILCHPLLLLSSIFLSIKVFSNDLALCIRWPKYWSFSFSIGPSNEYSGLISFRSDYFDLFAVQGTLKSPLQHHSLKTSILQCSAFFLVQLLHPYMFTGKTTSVGKVISLLFNICTLYVCHRFPSKEQASIDFIVAVTHCPQWFLEPKKIKSITAATFSPSICIQVMGLDAIVRFFNVEF